MGLYEIPPQEKLAYNSLVTEPSEKLLDVSYGCSLLVQHKFKYPLHE